MQSGRVRLALLLLLLCTGAAECAEPLKKMCLSMFDPVTEGGLNATCAERTRPEDGPSLRPDPTDPGGWPIHTDMTTGVRLDNTTVKTVNDAIAFCTNATIVTKARTNDPKTFACGFCLAIETGSMYCCQLYGEGYPCQDDLYWTSKELNAERVVANTSTPCDCTPLTIQIYNNNAPDTLQKKCDGDCFNKAYCFVGEHGRGVIRRGCISTSTILEKTPSAADAPDRAAVRQLLVKAGKRPNVLQCLVGKKAPMVGRAAPKVTYKRFCVCFPDGRTQQPCNARLPAVSVKPSSTARPRQSILPHVVTTTKKPNAGTDWWAVIGGTIFGLVVLISVVSLFAHYLSYKKRRKVKAVKKPYSRKDGTSQTGTPHDKGVGSWSKYFTTAGTLFRGMKSKKNSGDDRKEEGKKSGEVVVMKKGGQEVVTQKSNESDRVSEPVSVPKKPGGSQESVSVATLESQPEAGSTESKPSEQDPKPSEQESEPSEPSTSGTEEFEDEVEEEGDDQSEPDVGADGSAIITNLRNSPESTSITSMFASTKSK